MEYVNRFSYSQKGNNEKNEDLIVACFGTEVVLNLICDGMSSYGHGALAATIVTEEIKIAVQTLPQGNTHLSQFITSAIALADKRLENERRLLKSKFGVTLGGVISKGNDAHAFWFGDVKVFQIRAGKIIFESQEHSLRNAQNFPGTREEMYNNIVTASLCGRGIEKLTIVPLEICDKDFIIICSDGIWKKDVMGKIIHSDNQTIETLCMEGLFDDDHSLIKFQIVL